MGGAESKNERAEEEREAASAKRREIREKEFLEKRVTFIEQRLSSREPRPHFSRAEEKREYSPATERELMELNLMEESIALRRRQLDLDYLRTRHYSQRCYGFSPGKERADSPASSSGSMKSDRSKDFPVDFKRAEEKRENPPAKRRVLTKLESMEERLAFIQLNLLVGVRTSNLPLRENLWPHERGPNIFSSERSFGSSAEEERAVSLTLSYGSMMSDDSMDYPY